MRSDSFQVGLNLTTEEAFEKSKSNKKLLGQAVSYFLFDFGALCVAPSRTHLVPRWLESGGWRVYVRSFFASPCLTPPAEFHKCRSSGGWLGLKR